MRQFGSETSLFLLTIGDTAGALAAAEQDREIIANLFARYSSNTL
jgi:hypothetical protein